MIFKTTISSNLCSVDQILQQTITKSIQGLWSVESDHSYLVCLGCEDVLIAVFEVAAAAAAAAAAKARNTTTKDTEATKRARKRS